MKGAGVLCSFSILQSEWIGLIKIFFTFYCENLIKGTEAAGAAFEKNKKKLHLKEEKRTLASLSDFGSCD